MLCRLVLAAVKVRRVVVSCCVVCEIFGVGFLSIGFSSCLVLLLWVLLHVTHCRVVWRCFRRAILLSCCCGFGTKTHRENTAQKYNGKMQRQNATPRRCQHCTMTDPPISLYFVEVQTSLLSHALTDRR